MISNSNRIPKGEAVLSKFFIRGASASFIIKILGTGVLFGLQVLLARTLGATEYGIFVYSLTWVNYIVLFGRLGFDMSSLRFVSAYSSSKEWSKLRGYILTANKLSIASSITASVLFFLTLLVISRLKVDFRTDTLFVACFLIPITPLVLINESALKALRRIIAGQIPNQLVRPIVLGSSVIFASKFLGYKLEAQSVMALNVCAAFVSLIVAGSFLLSTLSSHVMKLKSVYETRKWIRVSMPMLFITTLNIILGRTDVIMLGLIGNYSDVGVLNATKQLTTLLLFGLVASNTIIGPMISRLYTENRQAELQRIVTFAARGTVLFTLPIALFYILKGDFILGFFGPSFIKGHLALSILTIGQFVNAFVGPAGLLLTMTGNQNAVTKVFFSFAVVNIIIQYFCIKTWGLLGSVICTASITAAWNIVLAFFAIKKISIRGTAI